MRTVPKCLPRSAISRRPNRCRAATEFAGDGASLVVHTAGAATFAARDELTAAAFADTAAAKISGLARLTELWPLRPDARILLCSSVSGVWGGRGHAAYSAANRLLDVMAGQLRADGRHCVAVRWGLWEGTPGQSGIAGADEVAQIERSGLRPMAPEIAIEASLREHRSDPLILAADRDRLRTFFESRDAHGAGPGATTTEIDIRRAGSCRTGRGAESRRRRRGRPGHLTARPWCRLVARARPAQAAAQGHRQVGTACRPARRHHRRRTHRQPRRPRTIREGGNHA